MKLKSYLAGEWREGSGEGRAVYDAITGEQVCSVTSDGLNISEAVNYARTKGGPSLRSMTFHDRANALKAMAKYLLSRKEDFYSLSLKTGATRSDGWIDIEGGIGTLFSFGSLVTREFPNSTVMVEGAMERLSRGGSFVGRHILTSKPGVSVHINAFNFPCWGMLEKIAPSLIAGVPVIVKPATPTAYLAEAMVKEIIGGNFFPEGSIQLICGNVGDLFDNLNEQDVVTFTGSASTGKSLRMHPNIVTNSIPFNMEADSLNCAILGETVNPEDPEFELFINEVVSEMSVKAGQKCTAIRRAIVPSNRLDAVTAALVSRLESLKIGDTSDKETKMGSLVGMDQVEEVSRCVDLLAKECEMLCGGSDSSLLKDLGITVGAFFPPTLLLSREPLRNESIHEVEAFGPVCTLMPYSSQEEAIQIAAMGKGSLVGSLYTNDESEARGILLGVAPWHGRLLVLNRDCAKESTGHGSPLAGLVHGGPGRAGGGEELGGDRAIKHYMQRSAVQGSPSMLTALTGEYHSGAATSSDGIHPFKKYFEDLQIGETLITHRRTVTEADIVNFGCVSGDHFYAHFDEIAAKDSFFGKRVAHGYFVISAAAGMFVDPAPGPVIANYGLENLRFVEPVAAGDTLQAKLTVKQKIKKEPKGDEQATGVVVWAIEVINQEDTPVAVYDIMTLVVRRDA